MDRQDHNERPIKHAPNHVWEAYHRVANSHLKAYRLEESRGGIIKEADMAPRSCHRKSTRLLSWLPSINLIIEEGSTQQTGDILIVTTTLHVPNNTKPGVE